MHDRLEKFKELQQDKKEKAKIDAVMYVLQNVSCEH